MRYCLYGAVFALLTPWLSSETVLLLYLLGGLWLYSLKE